MKTFIILSLTLSPFLINSSHPVMILILILMQTFLVCLLMWSLIKSSWMSFILFIIFLGGMMVLFVYITSLASNEKFEMKMNFYQNYMLSIFFLITMFILFKPLNSFLLISNDNFYKMISIIISMPNLFIIISIMTYLLITLVVAVKISNKFEGPLRNLN